MIISRAHLIAFFACFCVFSAFGDPTIEEAQKKLIEAREVKARLAKDKEEVRKCMEKLAAAGDAEAMYYLGCMYHTGSGGEQSDVLAVDWWKKAAAAGDEMAKNALATSKASSEKDVAKKKADAKKQEKQPCPTATEIAAACVAKYNEEPDDEKTAVQREQHQRRYAQWLKENYIGRRVVWRVKLDDMYVYNGRQVLANITTDDGIRYTQLQTNLTPKEAERFGKGQKIIFGADIQNVDSSGLPRICAPFTFDLPQAPKE